MEGYHTKTWITKWRYHLKNAGTLLEIPSYTRISPVWEMVALASASPLLYYSLQSREWKPAQRIWESVITLNIGPFILHWGHVPSQGCRSGTGLSDWPTQLNQCIVMENQMRWRYFVVAGQKQLHFDHIILTPCPIYNGLGMFLD